MCDPFYELLSRYVRLGWSSSQVDSVLALLKDLQKPGKPIGNRRIGSWYRVLWLRVYCLTRNTEKSWELWGRNRSMGRALKTFALALSILKKSIAKVLKIRESLPWVVSMRQEESWVLFLLSNWNAGATKMLFHSLCTSRYTVWGLVISLKCRLLLVSILQCDEGV